MTDLRVDLAKYGARLGIVEPLLVRCTRLSVEVRGIAEMLRQKGDFEAADKLRSVAKALEDASLFAFGKKL